MNIIGALDVPTKGEYYLGGEDVSKMEDRVALFRWRNIKMAATRLIALHINKGKTVAQCLADRTDYSCLLYTSPM